MDLGGEVPVRSGLTMAAFTDVVTLLKASSLRSPALHQNVLGETLDLGLLDRTMATLKCRSPSWEHRFGTSFAWRGLVVVRCCFYHVGVGESRRHGTTKSRRWTRVDGRAQGGGGV